MNYTMGRYIAELDTEGRDRLISAPEFSDGGWWDGSCGCLVATADLQIQARARADDMNHLEWPGDVGERARWLCRGGATYSMWGLGGPAIRYPDAVRRFGKARVVRAIKLRAARLNNSAPDMIAAITEAGQTRERVGR